MSEDNNQLVTFWAPKKTIDKYDERIKGNFKNRSEALNDHIRHYGEEPSLLYPAEVESLLHSLQRITQLLNHKQGDAKADIKAEANTWIQRLQIILRTKK